MLVIDDVPMHIRTAYLTCSNMSVSCLKMSVMWKWVTQSHMTCHGANAQTCPSLLAEVIQYNTNDRSQPTCLRQSANTIIRKRNMPVC